MLTKRPLGVTLSALLALSVAAWNGLRLGAAIAFWEVLKEFYARPGPLYLSLAGGFWLLAGLALAWGLWQGKVWAWKAAIAGAAGYASWYWFDRLVLQEPHANWPFALAVTVFLLALSATLLLPRKTRLFFHRKQP